MSKWAKLTFCVVSMIWVTIALLSCGDDKPPPQGYQMEERQGEIRPYIKLTEDLIYPGSEPFEDAMYHYFSEDHQAKVAHWFEVHLDNAEVKRSRGIESRREIWYIRYKDMTIVILPGPEENTSLIQYKRDIK